MTARCALYISYYVIMVPKRHGRTDGQTDRRLTVASPRSALASRGENGYQISDLLPESIEN